ncbi:hypothetical protein MTBBW1_2280002 [Desulfamplus magnetovallimortis]|uniref:Uncharacterized protein n=1 Tax=Desulfamplus magnetovallimortis TaxID=1246637 RepID=A0A1W1HDA6_9BACT|nr:hypothetical protein [Desulfamplus magnetovallimortis]SLM30460.1 hypothetical protein MTBBW1_2280002 [Desulfamplus magnetovallimortis]
MKLSEQAKRELAAFSGSVDFSNIQKIEIAQNPGTQEATNQFTDFVQGLHRMGNHPTRKHKLMAGSLFLL